MTERSRAFTLRADRHVRLMAGVRDALDASRPTKTTTSISPQADLAGADAGASDDPPPDTGELLAEAERFIALFHGENPGAGTLTARVQQVSSEMKAHGTYRRTPEGLAFAAVSHGGTARAVSASCTGVRCDSKTEAGERRGPDCGRVRNASTRGHQWRKHPADDHRLHA